MKRIVTTVVVAVTILAIYFMFRVEKEETIKIGAVLSLSGPASYAGEEVRDGMLLAVEEVNSWGGINGRKIELIIEDSKTDTQEGKNAMNRIEKTHHPILYVSSLSSVAIALAPQAKKNEVVLVALVATTPNLTGENEWVFRYYATAKDEVPPILSILEELKVKKLGILHLDDVYGASVFELLKKKFEETGGVVRDVIFKVRDTDFIKQITKLKDMEAIYVVGFDGHLKNVFKQLNEENFSRIIIGPATASLPSVKSLPESNGVYLAAPIIYNPNFLFAKEAKDKYETKYNKPFTHYAANGYDFMKLLSGLLGDKEISRASVKSLLEGGFIYPGVFGNLDVKRGEHDISFPLSKAQILNGRIKYLY